MLAWDRKFMALMQDISEEFPAWQQYMYKRYIDDSNTAVEELPLGARWQGGKVVVKPELVIEDSAVPSDLRTARVICEAANSLDPMIRMVQDCK